MPQGPSSVPDVDMGVLRSGLVLMALRALGDASAAEDVAQEALTRALAETRETVVTANFGPYVAGIARHLIADYFRAKRRTGPLSQAAFESAHDETPDALTVLCSDGEVARLRDALGALAVDDRELLTLCFFHDLSPAEIARHLGVPPERIRQRKLRALQRLRAAFDAIPRVRHAGRRSATVMMSIAGATVRTLRV